MAQRSGLLSQMWQNIRKSFVILRSKETFVGTDEHGNRYFEKMYDSRTGAKTQRRVEPKDPDLFTVPTVPTEWMTWLQGRRSTPPTAEERQFNQAYTMKTLSRAAQLEQQRMEEDLKDETRNMPQLPSSTAKQSFPSYSDLEHTPGEKKSNKTDNS